MRTRIVLATLFFSIALSLICATAYGAKKSMVANSLIYGGEIVSDQSPIYRSTVYWENNYETCTGTLIRKDIILTAAHCFDKAKKMGYVFFYKNKKNSKVRIKIAHVWSHEQYKPEEKSDDEILKIPSYDIAILKLEKDAPQGYTPAVIDWNRKPQFLEKVTLAGYGIGSRGYLHKIDEAIINYSESAKLIISDQDKTYGVCYGDSGGPAFYQDTTTNDPPVLAGLTSEFFVYSNNKFKKNSIKEQCLSGGAVSYTSVVDYRDWIEDKLK